jgi:hypothetical protein
MRPGLDIKSVPAGVTRVWFTIASAFFASAVVIHLLSYTPLGSSDAIQTIVVVLAFLLFPVWVVTIFSLVFSPVPLDRLAGSLPAVVKTLGYLLLAYVGADFLLMLVLLPGQPVEQNGHFFFNNHGAFTPISLDRYNQGLAYQARLFSGHEMAFYGVAVVLGYQLDRLRRGRITFAVPAVPTQATGVTPLSRLVVVETALSPDQCVRQLQAELDLVRGWSWAGRARLWGSVSADGFWLGMERSSRSALVFATGRFSPRGTGTRIQVHLQLKRWGWLGLIASAVFVAIFGAFINEATGGDHLVIIVAGLAAFVLFGNLALVLFERRRVLGKIESVLYAHRV